MTQGTVVTPITRFGLQRQRLRLFRRDLTGMIGLVIVLLYFLLALFGEAIAPYGYAEQDFTATLKPPSVTHPFGTDQFGRDVFSRVIVGSRDVIILASASTALALVLGTAVGLIAGYYGGIVDNILMRGMDILMAFPPLLLALLVISLLGSNRLNVILVIGVLFMPHIARVIRSGTLTVRPLPFIAAARLRGEGAPYIMMAEIFPNMVPALTVEISIRFTYAILMAATLGFLGLGVQPPSPDWGLMVNEGRDYLLTAPWIVVFPSFAIGTLVIGVTLLNDALARTLLNGSHT